MKLLAAPRFYLSLIIIGLGSAPSIVNAGVVQAHTTAELMQMLRFANTNPGPDTIVLASNSVYTLNNAENFEYGPNGLPQISSEILIEGNGAVIERSVSTPSFRFFYISGGFSYDANTQQGLPAGNLTLRNLALRGGLAKGGDAANGGAGAGLGGAILNQGVLRIEGVTLTGNAARGGDGGIGSGSGGGGIGEDSIGDNGGGFGGNFAGLGGNGGIGGARVSDKIGGGGAGGGIRPIDNGAPGNPGGAGGLGRNGGGNGGSGGGGSTFDASGDGRAGGGYGFGGNGNTSGSTSPVVGGAGGGGVGGGGGGIGRFNYGYSGDGGFGGGSGSCSGTIPSTAGFGGGGGTSTLAGGVPGFAGGRGGGTGTGPSNGGDAAGGGGGAMGGAIFNHFGFIEIENSTLAANTCIGGNGGDRRAGSFGFGGSGGSGFGGAIFNLNGTVTLRNCTVAANVLSGGKAGLSRNTPLMSTAGSSDAGGIYNLAYGDTFEAAATIASVTLVNTILSGSQGAINEVVSDKREGGHVNIAIVNAGDHNLVKRMTATNGASLIGTPLSGDPLLGPLMDNGGFTPTMALLAGSPAIDSGNSVVANSLAFDQRGPGFPRIYNGAVEIGAFEVQSSPPLFTVCPGTIAGTNAPGQCSALVEFYVSASGTPIPTVTCRLGAKSIASPYQFPAGTNVVTCIASNADGTRFCSFNVVVVDTEAPLIFCPTNLVLTADVGQCSIGNVTYPMVAVDNCGTPNLLFDPPSGSTLPIGTNTVKCVARDAYGNTNTCSFLVIVRDTEAPVIANVSASPNALWPPNHRLVPVTLGVTAADNCGPTACKIVSATSNESENKPNDGSIEHDIEITGDLTLSLRAEQSARGVTRVYSITVQCSDSAGNTSTEQIAIPVAR